MEVKDRALHYSKPLTGKRAGSNDRNIPIKAGHLLRQHILDHSKAGKRQHNSWEELTYSYKAGF